MNKTARWGALIVFSAFLVVGTAGLAGAQDGVDPYVGPSPTVASETTILEPSGPPPEVAGAAVTAASQQQPEVQGSSLAFTGGDVGALAVLALAALGGGVLLILTSRRRRTA